MTGTPTRFPCALNGYDPTGSAGQGGLPAVLRESNLITSSIDLAGASSVGAPRGFSELFRVDEDADTAFDYATRLERIDPTGRQGRLVFR